MHSIVIDLFFPWKDQIFGFSHFANDFNRIHIHGIAQFEELHDIQVSLSGFYF